MRVGSGRGRGTAAQAGQGLLAAKLAGASLGRRKPDLAAQSVSARVAASVKVTAPPALGAVATTTCESTNHVYSNMGSIIFSCRSKL